MHCTTEFHSLLNVVWILSVPYFKDLTPKSQALWLTSIILASWEAEIRRIEV
jgi:hypothetical protein